VFLLWRYRDRLGELIPRLRELPGGAKFDPPAAPQEHASAGDAAQSLQALTTATTTPPAQGAPDQQRLPPALETIRSPTVAEAERWLLNSPEIQALPPDPGLRERAFVLVAAAFMVAGGFERLEGAIWASQLALLQALNVTPEGMAPAAVKTMFFDIAASRFPKWFEGYPFERYLGFLTSFAVVAEASVITITEAGREYLLWRIRLRKPPKIGG
jgi:hypothetical protein